jgi:hypothetical protein
MLAIASSRQQAFLLVARQQVLRDSRKALERNAAH